MSYRPIDSEDDPSLSEFNAAQQSSSSNFQSDNNRYNISNVFKQIYALKYNSNKNVNNPNQSQTQNPSQNTNPNNTQVQVSTALKQFWMPDEQVTECFQCNEKFNTFRRRHVTFIFSPFNQINLSYLPNNYEKHCRVCGQIFCAKCSDFEIPSQLIWPNSSGNSRACKFCHSFVGEMETGDLKNNSKSIRELMKRLSLPSSTFYCIFFSIFFLH